MIELFSVSDVRAAEESAFRVVPEGTLMQRAAHALAVSCANLLGDVAGGVVGTHVIVLVGPGNNGGDALWAGAMLAARGARVDAVRLSPRVHEAGADALRDRGGRFHSWPAEHETVRDLVADADLVIDGILGIGGRGALRPEAAELAAIVGQSGCVVVAVDVPSGVDADTGEVAGAAIDADVTVTFGAVKPGLVLAPGLLRSGVVQLVDIGLDFVDEPAAVVLEAQDAAAWLLEPAEDAYKYRRGVVGVAAGSTQYPGAALLVTSAARHANVGMVRFLERGDGNARCVVDHFPDIVIDGSPPADQVRATAWACGSGFPGEAADEPAVLAVLAAGVPVVLDAGALTLVAESEPVRARIALRAQEGLVTVLTPHEGEFERLSPGLLAASSGRLDAARRAAAQFGAVVVLKGPGTVIANAHGDAFVDLEGTAALGTAGSGDVLTGLVGAVLASAWADGHRDMSSLTEATAAAVWVHGRAGRLAPAPATATDIAAAVPAAVRAARFGESP
jgi:hydroxyethylthiazole kinase-like uncharacterized protein yjeF